MNEGPAAADPLDLLARGAVAAGLSLPPDCRPKFARYLDLLQKWAPRAGLTAMTSSREIVTRHFLDSLLWLAVVEIPPDARLIDVGTGAGFPGVPVKIVRPDLGVTLLEATRRKVAFLEHLCADLGIEAEVVWGRAEEAAHRPAYREAFDLAVARAVAPLRVLVELCLPLVRPGGRGVFLKGPRAREEAVAAAGASAEVGGGTPQVIERPVPETSAVQAIVVVPKTGPTPARYPRRPGIPAHRPL